MWYSGHSYSGFRLLNDYPAICRDVIELAVTDTRGGRARGEEQLDRDIRMAIVSGM